MRFFNVNMLILFAMNMSTSKLSIGFMVFQDEKIPTLRYQSHYVYLIGSAHTDHKYVLLVEQVMKYVRPDIVGVELCRTRIGYKNYMNTSTNQYAEFDFQAIPKHKRRVAIGEKLRLLYAFGAIQYGESEEFRRTLRKYKMMRTYKLNQAIKMDNIAIGGELYVPFQNLVWRSAIRLGPKYLNNAYTEYKILLLDRPIEDTYQSISEALTEDEKTLVKSYKRDFPSYFREGYGVLMNNIWSKNAAIRDIFVNQRDEHMAAMIHEAITVHKFTRILCIVGRSHTEGIIRYLQKKLDK